MGKLGNSRFAISKVIGKICIQNWKYLWEKSRFNIGKNLGSAWGWTVFKSRFKERGNSGLILGKIKVQNRENQDPDSLNIIAEKLMNNCDSAVLEIYLDHKFQWPHEGPQETLLWSLEFVIQINLQHDAVAVWNLTGSWNIKITVSSFALKCSSN